MYEKKLSRRDMLRGLGAAGICLTAARPTFAQTLPTAPVAVAKCKTYGAELVPTLERLFDQIGGLGRIVKGKTVAMKLNLTGDPYYRLGYVPHGHAHWTSPETITAVIHLMGKAGARRIRLLESPWSTADPIEEYMLQGNFNVSDFVRAAPRVEFENTNYLGQAKRYHRFEVPGGGHLFPAYDLNHSYEDCDVFVSLAKAKEHATAGITLSMKNCFGMTPCTIYGGQAGVDEPTLLPYGGRSPVFHRGARQPPTSSPAEIDPTSPREGGYRVPRAVADLVAARPIDLAIVETIKSMAGGEGPWNRGVRPCEPGWIAVGTNCVTTDAVGLALMNFDPMADRGTAPFESADNMLRLAEELGVGTRDLNKIEVIGTPIEQARFDFRAVPKDWTA